MAYICPYTAEAKENSIAKVPMRESASTRHWLLTVPLGVASLVLASCAAPSTIKSISQEDARLNNNYVLALRISPQLNEIAWGATEGYVLLAREDGTADIIDVGYMDTGQLVWNKNGLFFSGPAVEYQLTSSGLHTQPRGTDEEYETVRFSSTDEHGYIAVYNVGISEEGDVSRVVVGDGGQPRYWDVSGMLTSIAQCDDKIVGITTSNEVSTAVKLVLSAPNHSEILTQLYPQANSVTDSVIGQVKRDKDYTYNQFMENAPCVNGVIYTMAEKTPVLEQEDGQLVLRAWSIHSNSYRDIPLTAEDGTQPQISLDHITSSEGSVSRDGSHYRWVAWEDGKVRSVDLASGVVQELFTIDLSHYSGGESRFFFTDTSVFVLDVNAKRDELKFSRYSITNGKKTDYFTIKDLPNVDWLRMPRNIIRDLAINPTWLTGHNG